MNMNTDFAKMREHLRQIEPEFRFPEPEVESEPESADDWIYGAFCGFLAVVIVASAAYFWF